MEVVPPLIAARMATLCPLLMAKLEVSRGSRCFVNSAPLSMNTTRMCQTGPSRDQTQPRALQIMGHSSNGGGIFQVFPKKVWSLASPFSFFRALWGGKLCSTIKNEDFVSTMAAERLSRRVKLKTETTCIRTVHRSHLFTHRTGRGDGEDVCGIIHAICRMGYGPTSINTLLLDDVDGHGATVLLAVSIHEQANLNRICMLLSYRMLSFFIIYEPSSIAFVRCTSISAVALAGVLVRIKHTTPYPLLVRFLRGTKKQPFYNL